ncbi:MAG TPA: tail fiber protein [Bryobacteraceae bacterium]|jgi:microcystin-dependent protein|nr:tail fiber protein [Bryobacteraceae bacterium]
MNDAFIGTILMFAGNFAPRGWALCQGQLMSIAQNSVLFSILGTMYGGDGITTFGLPDLRGRVPVGTGQGPGLAPVTQGEIDGSASVTLTITQIPAHNHTLGCSNQAGNQTDPTNHIIAAESQGATQTYTDQNPNQTMNPVSIGAAGGSQPHDNMQPYLGMNYIICLEGIYPSRS